MEGFTPKILGQVYLSTTNETTVCDLGTYTSAKIRAITLTNADTSARTVTLNFRVGTDTAGTKNRIVVSIPASDTKVIENLALGAGDLLSATAGTGNTVNVQVFGEVV